MQLNEAANASPIEKNFIFQLPALSDGGDQQKGSKTNKLINYWLLFFHFLKVRSKAGKKVKQALTN